LTGHRILSEICHYFARYYFYQANRLSVKQLKQYTANCNYGKALTRSGNEKTLKIKLANLKN